ncbi:hypothetical protein ACQEVB_27780 [Pseudonocardia sp. CA-107938]|uniref:hypothetical protein n=1 Tax=Pseudonocardia sp. CA-107938 TaxID=3240021 RepID=UPI003D910ADD
MAGETDAHHPLTARDRAILAAVAAGGAELVWGSEPDLYLDGRCCSDQAAVHRLVRRGLIAPATACAVGHRVAATVTAAGQSQLAGVLASA